MGEPSGRAGLALKAPAHDPLAGKHLDRHLAVEALVTSQPHGGEAAGAEAAAQAVAAEDDGPSDRGRRS